MIGFRVAKSEAGGFIELPPCPVVRLGQAPVSGAQQRAGLAIPLVSCDPVNKQEQDGFVDEWKLSEGTLILRGWALRRPQCPGAKMLIKTNLPVGKVVKGDKVRNH